MTIDLTPYAAATDAYQEAERDALTVRLLQSLPEGDRLNERDLEAAMSWLIQFQRQRDVVAVVLRGLAKIHVRDGEVFLSSAADAPLAPLSAHMDDEGIDPEWMTDRLDLSGPTGPGPPSL